MIGACKARLRKQALEGLRPPCTLSTFLGPLQPVHLPFSLSPPAKHKPTHICLCKRAHAACCVQVPHPLPLSWGRTVQPYQPPGVQQPVASAASADAENVDSSNGQQVGTSYLEGEDVLDVDFRSFNQPFQAVMINPGEASACHIMSDGW